MALGGVRYGPTEVERMLHIDDLFMWLLILRAIILQRPIFVLSDSVVLRLGFQKLLVVRPGSLLQRGLH